MRRASFDWETAPSSRLCESDVIIENGVTLRRGDAASAFVPPVLISPGLITRSGADRHLGTRNEKRSPRLRFIVAFIAGRPPIKTRASRGRRRRPPARSSHSTRVYYSPVPHRCSSGRRPGELRVFAPRAPTSVFIDAGVDDDVECLFACSPRPPALPGLRN